MLQLLHDQEIRNEEREKVRSEMLNTMIELMRSNGISNEQIENIRKAALKS